jgi:hypothetical protein
MGAAEGTPITDRQRAGPCGPLFIIADMSEIFGAKTQIIDAQ